MLDELCMSFEINADRMKDKAWKCLAMELSVTDCSQRCIQRVLVHLYLVSASFWDVYNKLRSLIITAVGKSALSPLLGYQNNEDQIEKI